MDRSVTVAIPADLNEIEKVNAVLEEAMRASAFSDDQIRELQLAVEEAIVNTVLHGYSGAPGEVTIRMQITDGEAEVRIEDTASPFNPLTVPEPDCESGLDERGIGGLGIYLIRELMDEVAYEFADGKNILTLVKRRAA